MLPMDALIDGLKTEIIKASDEGIQPDKIELPLETFEVFWGWDPEVGERFITVKIKFPRLVYAEIEDGTYGQMQGIRIYYEDWLP